MWTFKKVRLKITASLNHKNMNQDDFAWEWVLYIDNYDQLDHYVNVAVKMQARDIYHLLPKESIKTDDEGNVIRFGHGDCKRCIEEGVLLPL